MARIKHEALLPQMKADFATVAAHFNVDLPTFAGMYIESGAMPYAVRQIFAHVYMQKQSDDQALAAMGRPRILPYVSFYWLKETFYADGGHDSHIESMLKRVLVSFADADRISAIH